MATKLICPKCTGSLPESFSRGAAGVCPRCRGTFDRPRERSSKSAVVLKSRPYVPEPEPEPAPTKRWPWVAGGVASLIVVFAIVWLVWPKPTPGELTTSTSPSSKEIASTGPPPMTREEIETGTVLPDAAPPRVRAKPRVDGPSSFSSGGPKLGSAAIDAKKVDQAIDKGIDFLKKNPHRWQNTGGAHTVGYSSLPALALLEVGVPENDPVIKTAADLVRAKVVKERETYDLALAVLFLDRLGDPADRPLVRSLALRLIAGQTSQGGWGYHCPLLKVDDEKALEAALEHLRAESRLQTVIREPRKGLIDTALANSKKNDAPPPKFVKEMPQLLQMAPVLQPPSAGKGGDGSDNSNTQFALLALWAARRHGVPVDRTMLLGDQRFGRTQNTDGSWGYHAGGGGGPAMTCVGLLGLALGHGAMISSRRDDDQPVPRGAADPSIKTGLEALGRHVGNPTDDPKNSRGQRPNLYFLWSLERVAVLYQLPTIGGKDWYGWGAQHLLRSQRDDGGWTNGEYPGAATPLDTAFALLFLRQSNLVQDLTDQLQLHMAIADQK